jgi:hypothetical protein
MKRWYLAPFLAALVAGCAHVPFQETALVPLGSGDPRGIAERFQANTPGNYQLLSTVVFEYNWRQFSAISTVQINRADRVFKAASMNPMGVKLFELSGDQNSVTAQYVIAAFSRYGDITSAVGNDIRRIYFDLVPAPDATVWKRKYRLVFRQSSGPGFLEYVFAGKDGDLIEKNYYENNGIVWRVSYYEYRDQEGKRWPQGVVLTHFAYGYRLTVRHKEFRFEHN